MSLNIITLKDANGNEYIPLAYSNGTLHNGVWLDEIISSKFHFVYYSSSGDDSNDGSYGHPVLTLTKATELANVYEEDVYIVDGDYAITKIK